MIIEQAAIYLATGQSNKVYQLQPMRVLTWCILALVVGMWSPIHVELKSTPKGTIPWLWRVFMPRWRRSFLGPNLWTDGRRHVHERVIKDRFWSRFMISMALGMIPLTYYTNFPLIGMLPLLNRTWTGSGLASNGGNWDVAPIAGDGITFDGTSINNCTWDINLIFLDFTVAAAYTGVITTTSGNSISMTSQIDIAGIVDATASSVTNGGAATLSINAGGDLKSDNINVGIMNVFTSGTIRSSQVNVGSWSFTGVANNGFIDLDVGSAPSDWTITTPFLNCGVGSTTQLIGTSTSNIIFNGELNLSGDVNDLTLDYIDLTATGSTGLDIQVSQTGSLNISNSSFSSSVSDIQITPALKLELIDCSVSTVSLLHNLAGLAVVGTTPGSVDFEAHFWGRISLDADLSTNLNGTGWTLNLFQDDLGGPIGDATVTIDTTHQVEGCISEAFTGLVISAPFTINPTTSVTSHSFAVMDILDIFTFSPTVNANYSITLSSLCIIGAGGRWSMEPDISIANTFTISTLPGVGAEILVNDPTASISIQGQWSGAKVIMDQNAKIRINNASTSIFEYVQFSSGESLGEVIIEFEGVSNGSIKHCTFAGSNVISLLTSVSSDATWIIEDCQFTSIVGLRTLVSSSNLRIKRCGFIGVSAFAGIELHADFDGRITGCFFDDRPAFTFSSSGTIEPGQITNCSFMNGLDPGNSWTIHLVGCMFDPTDIVGGGSSNLISHHHNNTNNKQIFINNDTTLDANFFTVVNHDIFQMFWAVGTWDLNTQGDGYRLSDFFGSMKSVYIPVSPSTFYFVEYEGTDITLINVKESDFAQVNLGGGTTLTDTVKGFAFQTGPSTAFLQWDFPFAGTDEGSTVSHIAVKETDVNGLLVFNEDFLNKYKNWQFGLDHFRSVGPGVDPALTSRIGVTNSLIYGDFNYTQLILEMDVLEITTFTDSISGFLLGFKNFNNHYRVYAVNDAGTEKIRIERVLNGAVLQLNEIAIPSPTSNMRLRIDWQNPTTGEIKVSVDASVLATIVDTSFTNGQIGYYIGWKGEIDNVIVRQNGLFLRDVDLSVKTGVKITLASDGSWTSSRSSVDQSRAILIFQGGSYIEDSTTWLDPLIGFEITQPISISCNPLILVNDDLVIAPGGFLDLDGVVIKHVDPTVRWKIILATYEDPPFEFVSCRFHNLITTFISADPPGNDYELDPVNRGERIIDGPEPTHPVRVSTEFPYGFPYNFNTITGHEDQSTTLRFYSRDMCLSGKLREYMDDEVLFHVIWARGGLVDVRFINVDSLRLGRNKQNVNLDRVAIAGTVKEFRAGD